MHRGKQAFTLIELLVVIAIIAILAAILFPVFAQAKLSAKKAADLSNMKQIQLAALMYTNDYDDHYFFAMMFPPSAQQNYGDMYNWSSTLVIGPYIKNTQLFASPMDPSSKPNLFGYATPTPPRVNAPISFMANALSTDLVGLSGGGGGEGGLKPPQQNGGSCNYFPVGVTDCNGAIAPGSYWDRNGSDPLNTPSTPSTTTTQAANPAQLITFTNGDYDASVWSGCGSGSVGTETSDGCFGDDDLFWGWDAYDLASGTYFGSPDPNLFRAWRKGNNNSNFAFSDGHAKSLQPGGLLRPSVNNPFILNPVYFLINYTGN